MFANTLVAQHTLFPCSTSTYTPVCSHVYQQLDCIILCDELQRFNVNVGGTKVVNAPSFDYGCLMVGGPRGKAWAQYVVLE